MAPSRPRYKTRVRAGVSKFVGKVRFGKVLFYIDHKYRDNVYTL